MSVELKFMLALVRVVAAVMCDGWVGNAAQLHTGEGERGAEAFAGPAEWGGRGDVVCG